MTSLRPRRLAAAAATATLLVLPLGACGALSDDESDSGSDSSSESSETSDGADGADGATDAAGTEEAAFEPVTIEHAFGSTEIDERPERVVALGWGSADAAIAMDVIPVALDEQSYGATENGLMPWVESAIEDAGGELPETLKTGESPDFQAIDAADPDIILATYSGITEADYQKLSQIADTVAYPDQPWSTPWREVITTTGTALGESEKADQVLADIDAEVAAAADAHPEFQGVSVAAVAIDPSAFYVYTEADPRVQFLSDLGFEVAPSVGELDSGEGGFYYTLSTENVDQLTSDVLLSYSNDEAAAEAVASDPTYQKMQQFQDGTVASVVGEANVSSVSPPTALSLGYSLDTFVEALAGAVPAS
ncbi:iron-siderophore ABC transporter substrate-binding protein [Nocardioides marinquilinus]|uniref:Iron-siderophore ABC transporter substrate-binding protein n=1 Tax=Nocardioides marinquilinus TaxID=1210400 RepID=A0ABP9PXC3_9ACTN